MPAEMPPKKDILNVNALEGRGLVNGQYPVRQFLRQNNWQKFQK